MRDLTKWPRLLVAGDPVTEEQANEILIRTDSWWLTTNDKHWQAVVIGIAGLDLSIRYGAPTIESRDAFCEAMGVLELGYLDNNQIASAWYGGPHGWCSWSGQIGCSTFNIGKWPSHEAVTEEWSAIAAAFPYLSLTAQLVTEEGAGEVAGQWTVAAGSVGFAPDPAEMIRPIDQVPAEQMLAILTSGGERGVDFDRLAAALRQVRQTRAADRY